MKKGLALEVEEYRKELSKQDKVMAGLIIAFCGLAIYGLTLFIPFNF